MQPYDEHQPVASQQEKPEYRLILADDHTLFRDALVLYIRRTAPHFTLETTDTLDGVLDILSTKKALYNIILLDLRMPGMSGLQGLKTIRDVYPNQKVAILSGTADEDDIHACLKLGAVAYFPKTMKSSTLINAIDMVCQGDTYVATDIDGKIMPAYKVDSKPEQDKLRELSHTLSVREREIITHLIKGHSNQQIADALNLQLPTIKLHVSNVCRKLNAKNRTQAALIGQKIKDY